MALLLTGCTPGYRIHRADGVETLYHANGKGGKRIVYVVNEDGLLKIHDPNDPIVLKYYTQMPLNDSAAQSFSVVPGAGTSHETKAAARHLVRIGRIKAAGKRGASDPIHVMVYKPEPGPTVGRLMGGVQKAGDGFKQSVTDLLKTDPIIRPADHSADVGIRIKVYLKETAALNIKTHKFVPVQAFHFEVYVQSNYLPEHRRTFKGLGHWASYREIIRETVLRVNTYIKQEIGSTIPKDRAPFLTAGPAKIP